MYVYYYVIVTVANCLICAIDSLSIVHSIELIKLVQDKIEAIKIGLEFFVSCGIHGVKKIEELGIPIFLDLKLHDIPNTVEKTLKVLKKLNIFMLTVHVSGGKEMLKVAAEELSDTNIKIIGVTILTSISEIDIQEIDITANKQNSQVINLAKIAKNCGLDGVVCPGCKLSQIREECGNNFILVTPGVRPLSHKNNDHKEFITPSQAVQSGADYIVVGRPITNSRNPRQAAQDILDEIDQNTQEK